MAGTKKINKAKPRPKESSGVVINVYEVIQDMDGNPATPQEFDVAPHDEGEVFFKADDDATKDAKNRVLILNFIHQALHHNTERKVPVLTGKENPNIEVYHRVKYQGVTLDVCVYWTPRVEGEYKEVAAMVKFADDDLSAEYAEKEGGGVVSTDVAWTEDAQADPFTTKNDKLVKNYWAPRWKYVVNALRDQAYNWHQKNGVEIPRLDPHPAADASAEAEDDNTEKEEPMEFFAGASGAIIGPKGAKISEIKKSTGVKDIKMPAKNEDGPRPKARDLVELTIVGKGRAVAKAREMIQAVVDEWKNAPRPNRDGGGGSYQAAGDGAGDAWPVEGAGGGKTNGDTSGGGDWNKTGGAGDAVGSGSNGDNWGFAGGSGGKW